MERRPRPSPLLMRSFWASLRLRPSPLRTPHSGLKQVRVLPRAVAQLREPLAVNSDSATSVTDLPFPRGSPGEGEQRGTLPVPGLSCPVLLVGCRGHGGSAGSRRGKRGHHPPPQVRKREGPSRLLSRDLHTLPPVTSQAPVGQLEGILLPAPTLTL